MIEGIQKAVWTVRERSQTKNQATNSAHKGSIHLSRLRKRQCQWVIFKVHHTKWMRRFQHNEWKSFHSDHPVIVPQLTDRLPLGTTLMRPYQFICLCVSDNTCYCRDRLIQRIWLGTAKTTWRSVVEHLVNKETQWTLKVHSQSF